MNILDLKFSKKIGTKSSMFEKKKKRLYFKMENYLRLSTYILWFNFDLVCIFGEYVPFIVIGVSKSTNDFTKSRSLRQMLTDNKISDLCFYFSEGFHS